MTIPEREAITAALDALRAQWEARILPTVASKISDAHAHAWKALTGVLKGTEDGRKSLLQINRSPSYGSAKLRLAELQTYLTGATEVSQHGVVRDAREAFYRVACRLWFPLIPPDLLGRSQHEPTAQHIRLIRAAAIHGYDPRKFLDGPIGDATRGLKATLEQAGRRAVDGAAEDDLLTAWQDRTTQRLTQATRLLLSDSQVYADTEAGIGLIHPDWLE